MHANLPESRAKRGSPTPLNGSCGERQMQPRYHRETRKPIVRTRADFIRVHSRNSRLLSCSRFCVKSFRCGTIDARQPQRTTQVIGSWTGTCHFQPATIFLMRLVRINKDVAVTVFCSSFRDHDFLVPAMLSADWIRLYRKYQVLVDAGIFPMNPRGIGIVARERTNSMDLAHHPLPRLYLLQVNQRSGPAFSAGIFLKAPASEMVRARYHTGPDRLGHPDPIDKVADVCGQAHKISRGDTHPLRI